MIWNCGPLSAVWRSLLVRARVIVTASSLLGLLLSVLPTAVSAAGNAISGKEIYQNRCLGCHGGGGTENTLGPSLVGIIGRKAGTGDSGVHSRAMTESGIRWDETSLRIFLAAPTKTLRGTNMPVSVDDAGEIDDLIAYLKTLR
jgi:cytochrome c